MSAEAMMPSPAEPTVAYEVTAVRYGRLRSTRGALFHHWSSYSDPDADLELAFYFWVLRGGGRTILVDTGFDPAAAARRKRECLAEPVAALERIGIGREEVDAVLVTHFHYDHVGNLGAYPGAELIVGQTELEFWTSPMARRQQFAVHVETEEVERIERAAREGRARTVSGDEQVLPGVRALEVGGHTPGQLLVVVAGEDGDVVLTSDAVHFYEELELDRPFAVVADLAQMYAAYDTVHALAGEGAAVVAGHDPAVMERFGSAGDDAALAVQVSAAPNFPRQRPPNQ